MKQLLEAIRAKYLCLHDWEVVSKTEYTDCIRNGNFFLPKPRYGKENNLYGKRGSKSPRSVVTKEVYTCIMYLHRLGYNKRSLSRILLLHPNTINRVLNKPQDYEY